ncbi:hypothetical protein BaRGS_00030048, partial [Batillaria attramentaria]
SFSLTSNHVFHASKSTLSLRSARVPSDVHAEHGPVDQLHYLQRLDDHSTINTDSHSSDHASPASVPYPRDPPGHVSIADNARMLEADDHHAIDTASVEGYQEREQPHEPAESRVRMVDHASAVWKLPKKQRARFAAHHEPIKQQDGIGHWGFFWV